MEFWILFYGYIIGLTNISYFIPRLYKKIILVILLLSIWGVASFRYMVGTDYPMYMSWVYGLPIDSLSDIFSGWTEPMPAAIILMIKSLGLGSQMFFVITETIILACIYKGCKLYFQDTQNKLLFFSLYTVMMLQGLYFWSMNGIRQSMALSVGFIALYYLILGNKKWFCILFFIAFLFHSSAIFLLLGIVFLKFHVGFKSKCVVLLASFAVCLSGVSGKIVTFALKNAYLYGEKYGTILSSIDLIAVPKFGIAPVLLALFMLALLYAKRAKLADKYKKMNFDRVEDIAFGYIVMRLFTNFSFVGYDSSIAGLLETLIHRVEVYFVLLYIVYIVYIIYDLGKSKGIVMKVFASIFITMIFSIESVIVINMMLTDPVGAALYQANFDLLSH